MGASSFRITASGKNAKDAFKAAVDEARHEHGHGRYTGTIAEKSSFVSVTLAPGASWSAAADKMLDENDRRIADKWGPCGCITVGPDPDIPGNTIFCFFGNASC